MKTASSEKAARKARAAEEKAAKAARLAAALRQNLTRRKAEPPARTGKA